MLIEQHQIRIPMILNLILLLFLTAPQVNSLNPRKLDETTVPPTNGDAKCGSCGSSSPPPPPPPSPCPPPPANPPPSPPPPSPKKPPPSSQYCPPPPPSSYIYITGPPGNLYPVDENYNGATRRSLTAAVPVLAGLLILTAFW